MPHMPARNQKYWHPCSNSGLQVRVKYHHSPTQMKEQIFLLPFFLLTVLAYGQSQPLDSVKVHTLNSSDKLAKCIFLDSVVPADERKAHELIWALRSVRDLAEGFLKTGTYMETVTVTLERPSDGSLHFIIALYNRQPKAINKLMIYRVDLGSKRIERRYDEGNEWTESKD